MNLKAYLKSSNISRRAFSESLGIHYMHLSNILRKCRRPSPELALKIERVTGGAVTLKELLFPDLFPDQDVASRKGKLH